MRLGILSLITAIVWLTILPRIHAQPAVHDYIEHNERLGIDPAAKFYTELPCMPAVFNRVKRARCGSDASPSSRALKYATAEIIHRLHRFRRGEIRGKETAAPAVR